MKQEYKKILFRDVLESCTSYDEMMKLIPCMVCQETKYGKEIERQSYNLIGFGPKSVILGYAWVEYDYDAEWGDGKYIIDAYEEVDFEDIDDSYVYTEEATQKQLDWLDDNGYDTECVSKYEAWHIIDKHVFEQDRGE